VVVEVVVDEILVEEVVVVVVLVVDEVEVEEEDVDLLMKGHRQKYAVCNQYLFTNMNVLSYTILLLLLLLLKCIYVEVGSFLHDAEGEMVCRLTNAMIPYFNAGIYLHNKAKIGKVEEVFGPVNKVYFTIKPDSGVNAASFKAEDKVYIGTDKLLPLSRFTNESKGSGGRGAGRGGGGRGGGRGGFTPGGRGGRGGPPGMYIYHYIV
jgi:rRNA processing protein Gar1